MKKKQFILLVVLVIIAGFIGGAASSWFRTKDAVSAEKKKAKHPKVITAEEFRFDEDGNTISGYAARFNVWSEDLGYFREKIKKGVGG